MFLGFFRRSFARRSVCTIQSMWFKSLDDPCRPYEHQIVNPSSPSTSTSTVYSNYDTLRSECQFETLALCTHALKTCSQRTGCLCASLHLRAFEQQRAFLSPLVEHCNTCPNSCSKATNSRTKKLPLTNAITSKSAGSSKAEAKSAGASTACIVTRRMKGKYSNSPKKSPSPDFSWQPHTPE